MKTFKLSLIGMALGLISLPVLAADIVAKTTIKGEPVVVTEERVGNDVVYVSPSFTTKQDYYYVTMGKKQQVCYETVPDTLASVNAAGVFTFRIGGQPVSVHCYTYSPDYFVVETM